MTKEWIVPDADLGCDGEYFDYEEIIRCERCKFGEESELFGRKIIFCEAYNNLKQARYPDFFCGFGRPKEGTQE